jgi:diguanylate cyclase (GGDEF)-like protein
MALTAAAPSSGHTESAAAWQLIREDVFDRSLDDDELDRLVAERAKTSGEPHADLIRLMVGMSLPQDEAQAMFARILEHRREMSRALGRAVHVRVAALDLLTMRPATRKSRRDSRPIIVAPSLLERALEEAGSDGVTGLPRASRFMNLLQHELLQRRRRVTVAFIDLDGFKRVNDRFGHCAGDAVITTESHRLASAIRPSDTLARIGGDEFLILCEDVHTRSDAITVAQRVIDVTARPFDIDGESVELGASVGVAFTGDVAATTSSLVQRADRAMYAAKTLGRGQIAVCQDDVATGAHAPTPTTRAGSDGLDMPVATRVEVRERFRGGWSSGFDVATTTDGGYRLRRISDDHVLPGEFAAETVRRAR